MNGGSVPVAAAALFAFLAACATAGSPLERGAARATAAGAPASALAAAGFHDWLHRGDAASAAARFAAALDRDGRDPWARLGASLSAQRVLDEPGEAAQLLALLAGAPAHPLAPVAARRLVDLASRSPAIAGQVERDLGALLDQGRLAGFAAFRARVARAAAAESRGDLERAAALRAENGAVQRWTLVGPFGALAGLELDRPFPPEAGVLPERSQGPAGVATEARSLLAPDGLVALDGEPPGADVWYLASDVRLSRGGQYLMGVGSGASFRAWVDGSPVAERRAFAGFPAAAWVAPLSLPPGTHRLLVKLARGSGRPTMAVSFARADGAPSDAESAPVAPGRAAAPARPGPAPAAAWDVRALAAALEPEVGPALARLVAARDRIENDRETAKALLAEAAALLPGAPLLLAARGEALQDDPTLAERVARSRAEAAFAEALRQDPGDAATRLRQAELLRAGDRLDDVEAILAGLAEPAASRPRALVARARFLAARGFPEGAEKLLEAAPGDCQAREALQDLSARRQALAREDQLARELAECPGGRERLAEHLRRRGEAAAALEIWRRLAGAAPARLEPGFALARALSAGGDPAAGAREVEAMERLWPREPRLPRRRAELLELAGDRAGARAARERALSLDGADLSLRRALALEDGTEVLASMAQDGRAAALAWKASRFRPATSSLMVLDAMAVEAHPDGAWTERVHQVIHLNDPRGVERWGEVSVPAGAEVVSLRSLKPDGRVLEPEEGGGGKTSASLSGLEPGDLVEVEWLRAHRAQGAAIPGFAVDPFFFRVEDVPLFRSTLAVAAPGGAGLEVDAHHMPAPAPRREGSREEVRLEAREVEALVSEPGDPGVTEYLPFVQVGAGAGLEAMQLAIAEGLLDKTRASLEIRELAASVARPPGGASRPAGEALLRAAYDRVAELVEGQGGAWADPASQVLSRGRGNRTTLLKALYSALGVKARLAMVRPFTADPGPYRFPRPDLYGHQVLRVEQGGRAFWLDPSTRYTPFGVLPQAARECEALLLPEPGEAPEVARTPRGEREGRETVLRVALDRDGSASIEGEERYLGFDGAAARAALERLDAPARKQAVEQSLARSFRGLALESLAVEGERRSDVPLVMRWRARAPSVAHLAGERATVDATVYPVRLGARFVQRAARQTPLLVAVEEHGALRMEVNLPRGAEPPPGLERQVDSPFGSFRRSERWDGKALVREEQFDLKRGRIPPEAYPEFVRFAAAVDEAQGEPMALGTWR
ncbi:MAG TPA: hypothetical protein VFR85_13510 [Anaeromyxobacteraceae bacterium]|nr:hypothetical protein [Anaeromyxobacteraceae bacterium]